MILRKTLLVAFAGFSLAFAGGQPGLPVDDRPAADDRPQPPPGAQPAFTLTMTAGEAVQAALADAQKLPVGAATYTRWVWVQDGDARSYKTLALTMNYVSRASTIQRPFPMMEQRLVRIDLRQFWPRDADLVEAAKLWEDFAFDPSFALLLTKDTLNFNRASEADLPKLKRQKQASRRVVVPGKSRTEKTTVKWEKKGDYKYPDDSGRVVKDLEPGLYDVELRFKGADEVKFVVEIVDEEAPTIVGKDVDVVRLNAPHLGPEMAQLQALTGSLAPIVSDRYLKYRLLTAVKDVEKDESRVYDTIFGGRYYEAAGVRRVKDVDKEAKDTDLDLFLEELGVGNRKAGLSADAVFARLRSDQRLVLRRSNVTGKPREVTFHPTLSVRFGANGAITGDIKNRSIDIGDRPFANLLTPRRDAREAIFPKANGFPLFALFNGQGARQDSVPDTVAHDTTIPNPHTKILEPGIGCIRCHGPEEGWKPVNNDVLTLLKDRPENLPYRLLELDLGARRSVADPDTIDRLAGLATGKADDTIRVLRDTYAKAVYLAAGAWDNADKAQTDVAKVSAERIADEFAEYYYDLVDARKALREIGIDAPADKAVSLFKDLVAVGTGDAVGDGVFLEDVRVRFLRAGDGISRADWSLVQSGVAERALTKLRKAK
jgi:hypothetical protein